MRFLLQNGLDPPGQFTARQHHPPTAAFALQADIRAEPDDSPFIGTAGVWFTQAQVGVELQIRKHIQLDQSEGWDHSAINYTV
jgi:hypothetical protein